MTNIFLVLAALQDGLGPSSWKIIGAMGVVISAMAAYIVRQQAQINGILREWLKEQQDSLKILNLVHGASRGDEARAEK